MMSKAYENYARENKTVVEEAEEQLFKLTSENLELHRKIRVGLEAEKQLRNNQKALDGIAEMYLELRKNQLNKGGLLDV
jgi:hypothetical protein